MNHGEVGFHNTIAEVAALVREPRSAGPADDGRHLPHEHRGKRHARAAGGIRDILAHVHLSETNRDVLGTGHWPTAAFLENSRGSTTAATAPWASTTPAARGGRAWRSAWRN